MKGQEAKEYYIKKKCNCAQGVIGVFADEVGLDLAQANRALRGFGLGMGGLGQACGAFSGAVAVISAKYGDEYDVKDKRYEFYKIIKAAGEEFKERTGALSCPELKSRQANKGEHTGKAFSCAELVEIAADIAEKYIK